MYKKYSKEPPKRARNHMVTYEPEVLSCFINAAVPEALGNMVMNLLDETDFCPYYRELFSVLKRRYLAGQECTVSALLAEEHVLRMTEYIAKQDPILNFSPVSFLGHKAMKLKEVSIREMFRVTLEDYLEKIPDNREDTFKLMEGCSDEIVKLYPNTVQGKVDVGSLILQQIDNAHKTSEEKESRFLISGIPEIDSIVYGYDPGEFVVIGARPGMGKTGFSVSQSIAWASMGVPHLYMSLEMTSEQMINRYIAQLSGVSTVRLTKSTLTKEEQEKIQKASSSLLSLNKYLIMDDKSDATPEYIRAKTKQYITEHGIKAVIIDYLQRVSPTRKDAKREREVSEISNGLSRIAKDFGVPVICLAQLNRGVEARIEKRPSLQDLRDSGSIEQDAHKIGFLYRPEYYDIHSFEDGTPTDGKVEIIFAKNRDGAIGTARVNFIKDTTAFESSLYGKIWQ